MRLETEKVRITEKLLHVLWEGSYGLEFRCEKTDGSKGTAKVIFPGIPSSRSCDFEDALFLILIKGEREEVKSDVEIHISLSDWFRHEHKPARSVKVHVVWNFDKESIPAQKLRELPEYTVILSSVEGKSDTLVCNGKPPSFKAVQAQAVKYGRIRILRRSEMLKRMIMDRKDENQVLWELVARALGYEKFKNEMQNIARKYLHKNLIRLPENAIREIFEREISNMQNFDQTKHPSRPLNFPEKRLDALVRFAKFDIKSEVLKLFESKESFQKWYGVFQARGLGKQRFATICANVFIPFLLLKKDENEVFEFFKRFPPEEGNRKTRAFGKLTGFRPKNPIESQGAMEIFEKRCSFGLCGACEVSRKIG